MRRCDYCGGKLGLVVHRKWKLRFCKLACKNAYEHHKWRDNRHRTGERIGYDLLALPICNPSGSPVGLTHGEPAFSFSKNAAAVSFERASIFRVTNKCFSAADLKLETMTSVANLSIVGLPTMVRLKSLFRALVGTFVGSLRDVSARIAEYFHQRLSPTVGSSALGDFRVVRGLGVRLLRDSCTNPCNNTQRLERARDVFFQALNLHQG
jgi:hypothetical protein